MWYAAYGCRSLIVQQNALLEHFTDIFLLDSRKDQSIERFTVGLRYGFD
jgi:hypothetical protein